MKRGRRLLSLMLAVLLCASMLPVAALAEEEAAENLLAGDITLPVVEEEAPVEEEVPVEEDTPVEEDFTEEETPAEEVPVEEENPAEEETPAEEEVNAEEETPAGEETLVEEEISAEEETPVEEEAVAEVPELDGYYYYGLGPVKITGGQRDMHWPVPSAHNLQSCFYDNYNGARGSDHYAIDISAASGTKIVAAYDGTVVAVNKSDSWGAGFGYWALVKHDYKLANGTTITLYTAYNHMSSVSVSVGDTVTGGSTKIGGVGTTGYSQDNHLDFQILYNLPSSYVSTWYNYYQSYSIDPYSNQLLELPSDLAVYDAWYCGTDYYNKIVELYSEESSYLSQCTLYPSYLTIKIIEEDEFETEPKEASTDFGITAEVGETYTVTGLYQNSYGNYWYAVSVNGETAYLWCPRAEVVEKLFDDISISGVSAPSSIVKGNAFAIAGNIASKYNTITYVHGYVYPGTATSGTATLEKTVTINAKSYALKGSAIDSALTFNTLGTGTYTYVITVQAKNHYSEDGTTLSFYHIPSIPLVSQQFYVTASSTTSYTIQYDANGGTGAPGNQTKLKDVTLTLSSTEPTRTGYTFLGWATSSTATAAAYKAGGSYTANAGATLYAVWEHADHSYSSEVVTEATCTETGTKKYTCTVCSQSYSESIPALGHTTELTNQSDATCTKGGYTGDYVCSVCGTTTSYGQEIEALGHSYGEWYEYDASTMRRDCTVCGEYEEQAIVEEDAPQIIVSDATAAAGDTVEVTVSLKNNPGINTFTLSIQYDETRLSLNGVTAADSLGGTFIYSENTKTVAWQAGSDTDFDGTAFTLSFTVLEDAPDGDGFVSITYKSGNICNFDEEDVDFAVVAGAVTVSDYLPGDINGDGTVNNKDLNRLMKYLTDESTAVVKAALDVNGDGSVNNKDLNRLMKYLTDDTVEIH